MKTLMTLGLCLAVLPVAAADLTVTLKGSTQGKGMLMLSLFDSDGSFPAKGALRRLMVDPATGTRAVFKDLPPGRYALAAYKDENGNGALDRNDLGIPVEPYGFSGGASGRLGAPSFGEAAVSLGTTDLQTTIELD